MPPTPAVYIWNDTEGAGRNRYVLFRKNVVLGQKPVSGTLHLFADTHYRLLVNGKLVGHGPARFAVSHPEYDSYDLTPYLQPGDNIMAVIVNSVGRRTFSSEASHGGLIAWGELVDTTGNHVWATDASWRALESPAHASETAILSFALNPAELLDLAALPAGWDAPGFDDSAWPHAVPLLHPEHWGALSPRSIPLLDEREATPPQRIGTWMATPLADEDRYTFCALAKGINTLRPQSRAIVFAYLHSPREQEVTFGAWWGYYWVNGAQVKPTPRTDVTVRQDFTVRLHTGWNTLVVVDQPVSDLWQDYLSFPRSAGITVSAEPRLDAPDALLIGGPWTGEQLAQSEGLAEKLTSPEALPAALGPWQRWPRQQSAQAPYFDRGGRRFTRLADNAVPTGDSALVMLYDFGTEVLGRPIIDFTAVPGTRIDFFYSERINEADGLADHYSGNPTLRMCERCVSGAGRQQWRTFHPRGMRYLEVVVYGDLAKFTLHRLGFAKATYPATRRGAFTCSDPTLTQIWQTGCGTLEACMEDAFLDCPARERGLYSMDYYIQSYLVHAVSGDTQLMRRCAELYFLSQGKDGTLGGLVPSTGGGESIDFMCYPLLALCQYVQWTGDLDFARTLAPRVRRLLDALQTMANPATNLVDWRSSYIDICVMDRSGENCALNCFVQRAFAEGARLLATLGDASAAQYAARAAQLAVIIRRDFWDVQQGVFTDRRAVDKPETTPSVPANTLPILFGIAGATQTPRALAWLCEAITHNTQADNRFLVNTSFAFHVFAALYQQGRTTEAETFMRKEWGMMLKSGAVTWWEYFADCASRCHAWSGSPTYFLSSAVLGVTFPEPGNTNRVRIAPHPGTLSWAKGIYPHPRGNIDVDWRIENGKLNLTYHAPAGVTVDVALEDRRT